jgi:uncharacterized delta-60 repeat protein
MPFSSLLEFLPDPDPLIVEFYQVRVTSAENIGFFDAASQADGKLIVVGQFTNYNGSAHNGIVRLNSDGSIDSTFDPGAGPQWVGSIQTSTNRLPRVESIALVNGEKILIAGNFEAFSGTPFNGLARLNSDGSVDTNFSAGLERGDFGLFARSPARLIPQPDGNFLLAGQFRRPGQSAMPTLSRLLMRPSLSVSTPGPGGPPQLSLTGGADRTYFIQTSTDLDNWMTLTNVTATNDDNSFVDPPILPRRYYRAMSLP